MLSLQRIIYRENKILIEKKSLKKKPHVGSKKCKGKKMKKQNKNKNVNHRGGMSRNLLRSHEPR